MRRVISGASSDRPAATVRTAPASSRGGALLSKEPARASAQRVVDVGIVIEGGQDQYACADLRRGKQTARGLDPVEAGHPDVHDEHVWLEPQRLLDGLTPVGCLSDHLDVVLALEDRPKAAAHERLVVNKQHADHRAVLATGSRTRTLKPPSGRGPASMWPS
jgi:hypothetical protein